MEFSFFYHGIESDDNELTSRSWTGTLYRSTNFDIQA